MIFVAGTLTIDPSQLADFEREVAAMRPKVLEEAGCRHYSLLTEDRAGGVINVLEAWDDDEALAVHLKQPWIETFYARFSPHIQALNAKIYDISGSREIPLG